MALYSVEPDRRSLHGAFSRDFAPILTIDSGDTVRFRTLDADWNLGRDRHHALAMASVIVDLRISQIVNQIRGVHAVLPHGAIANVAQQENSIHTD